MDIGYSWIVFFFLLVFLLIGLGFRSTKEPEISKTRLSTVLRSMVQGVLIGMLVLIVYDFFFQQNLRWDTYTALLIPPTVFAVVFYLFSVRK